MVGDTGQGDVALQEMRERLLRDAAAAGTAEGAVLAAVDEAAAGFAEAWVRSFIAVLVEREVRARLKLSSYPWSKS